jgi:hypothetical protein
MKEVTQLIIILIIMTWISNQECYLFVNSGSQDYLSKRERLSFSAHIFAASRSEDELKVKRFSRRFRLFLFSFSLGLFHALQSERLTVMNERQFLSVIEKRGENWTDLLASCFHSLLRE